MEKELQKTNDEKQQLKVQNEDLKNRLRRHEYEKIIKARSKAKRKFQIESFFYINTRYILWIVIIAVVVLSIFLEKNIGVFTIISGLASIVALVIKLPSKAQRNADIYRLKRYRLYIGKELENESNLG